MEHSQPEKVATDKFPMIALAAGIISLMFLIAAVMLGIMVEDIGIVSFFSPVLLAAVTAIICGAVARKRVPGSRMGLSGMILGIIVLGLIFIARVAVFLFFLPWLGA